MDKVNQQKAELLYGVIDKSDFYRNDVANANRSRMNVPFQLADSSLDKVFLEESFAAGLHALKGHRVVGGMRAPSITRCRWKALKPDGFHDRLRTSSRLICCFSPPQRPCGVFIMLS